VARHRAIVHVFGFVFSCLLAACGTPPAAIATSTPAGSPVASATAAVLSPSPTPSATLECAAQALASMTEDQRIGQLFLLGLANDQLGAAETDAIRTQHFGSVWFVERSTAGVAAIRSVADAVQAMTATATTANVRFFIAANQEGGLIQSLSGPGFTTIPSALDQSSIDPNALRTQAVEWGRALASAGVNLNFAPVVGAWSSTTRMRIA
jgi:beta-N-acetylhexosaminidase